MERNAMPRKWRTRQPGGNPAGRRKSRLPRRYGGYCVRTYGQDTPNDSSQDRSTGPTVELASGGRESPDPHASSFSLCVNPHSLGYKRGDAHPLQGIRTFTLPSALARSLARTHTYTHQRLGTLAPSLARLYPLLQTIEYKSTRARTGRRDIQPKPV